MASLPSESSSATSILISTTMLPTEETVFFQDSSFFKYHTSSDLPTAAEINAAALPGYAHHVSLFPSLSLAVKRVRVTTRHRASAAEGQTLWAIWRFLPEVRVPEVYGWRREGRELFLFMELIEGDTLSGRWAELTEAEQTRVCAEVGAMVRALRRLRRPDGEVFVGAIGGQPSMESLCFGRVSDAFPNTTAFYEFFMRLPSLERERAHEDFGLPHLPYDSPIVFAHCDLNFSNIMITPRSVEGPLRVLAIVDWEQSGWMPSFWEYAKPRLWMMSREEARDMIEKLPEITGNVPEDVFIAYATYVQAFGGY